MKTLVQYPAISAPDWAARVERWTQLDEVTFCFCESLHRWDYLKDQKRPGKIFLAIEGASNLADFEFVQSKALSPAKFVYTLPNVCLAVLLKLVEFQGPAFCFHKGRESILFARAEAQAFANHGESVWLFASPAELIENKRQILFEIYEKKP